VLPTHVSVSAYLELGLNVPGDESQCLHASAEVRDLLVLPGTDDLVEARHGELGHCADELGGKRHVRDPAQQRTSVVRGHGSQGQVGGMGNT